MDLKAKQKTLIGQRVGVEGEIYSTWEGDVLKGVPDHHAKQLLEAQAAWEVARSSPPRASAPAQKPPPAPPAPEPEPEPEPVSEPSEASDDEDSDGYSEEDLMSMTKTELLEFLDETEKDKAAKLKKDELVKLILEGAE